MKCIICERDFNYALITKGLKIHYCDECYAKIFDIDARIFNKNNVELEKMRMFQEYEVQKLKAKQIENENKMKIEMLKMQMDKEDPPKITETMTSLMKQFDELFKRRSGSE